MTSIADPRPLAAVNPWAPGAPDAPRSETGSDPRADPDPGPDPGSDLAPGPADWLDDTATEAAVHIPVDLWQPFQEAVIPLGVWVEQGLDWLVVNFRPLFQAIRWPIDATLGAVEAALLATPHLLMLAIFGLLGWQAGGWRLGLGAVLSLTAVGLIGVWDAAMVTLALVLTAVLFCLLIGLPGGIALARSARATAIVRPLLDAMQTTPAFVYLVPVVMLFGIGNVPGVVVTIIFALPPLVRLTSLGIRQVPPDLIEAARAFGASPRQLLFKVQLPLALPTIMAGVNQTLMLALSMVVIASMIAVGGLGQMVLRGIGRLDMGLATIGGVGIVMLAILLDRLTQSVGRSTQISGRPLRWFERGPIALVLRPLRWLARRGRRSPPA